MLATKEASHIYISSDSFAYYTISGMEELHNEMQNLLQIIDTVCRDNNIPYWIDGGSLIGTIRHNGFIPWDDDIDISLLKQDYLKLINLLDAYSKEHKQTYLYFSPIGNQHCCNYFASRKNIYSRMRGSYELIPVKVDIRPMNVIDDSPESIRYNKILREYANILIFNKPYFNIDVQGCRRQYKNKSNFLQFYNNNYGMSDIKQGLYVHPYYEFSNDFYMSYGDIFPLKRHVFESIEVNIPNKYDELLRNIYGDYMVLPDIKNRAPVASEIIEKRFNLKHMQGRIMAIDFIINCGLSKLIRILRDERK